VKLEAYEEDQTGVRRSERAEMVCRDVGRELEEL
jgi:hypothetical protein